MTYFDPRVADRHRRVLAAIDRDRDAVLADTEVLRAQQVVADGELEQARAAEQAAWAKYERTGRRRAYYAWQDAMTARERAHDNLMQVCALVRRAGRRYDELGAPDEFRRRVRQAERLDTLRAQQGTAA